MAATGTIKLPGVGPVKKQYVYYGGAAVGGLLAYAYYNRYRELRSTETEPVYGEGYDEFGNLLGSEPYQTSPGFSGLTPSGEEDKTPGPGTFANNAEWSQYVIEYLISIGIDPAAAAGAIGKYLDRQQLSAEEQTYVRTALAAGGAPPQGTFSIVIAPGGGAATNMPAPGGLKSTVNTDKSVTLSWNTVAGASGYQVKRASGPGAPGTATTTSTSRRTPVLANGTYKYEVRARNSAGQYGPPASITVTISSTSGGKVGSLVGLKFTRNTSTVQTISWKPVTGATSYTVVHEILSSPGKGQKGSATVTGTTFTSSGLNRGSKHKYTVRGRNNAGQSGTSSTIIGTTKRS